jgi:site-specific DNA recombinase
MKYILYCRKSTDTEDKQALSLDSQEKELLELASKLELNVISVLRESRSAKEPGRPVFNQMLESISNGEADGILCWKIDRLTRNPIDGGKIQWLLQQNCIKAICTPGRTYDPSDNVMLMSIEQAMATQYIRNLSNDVKRGNKTKLEQGGWPNRAPFGYRNDKATKKLTIHKQEAKLVSRTFELYATGQYTMGQVRKILNQEGFRTASNTELNKSLIERIIKNPFYVGVMLSHEKYYPGTHAPIVTKATYDLAQSVLNGTTRPKSKSLFFPLRGLLICASCSCQYTASLKKGHQYYYCTNGKGMCEAHSRYMRSEPATKLVSNALGEVKIERDLIEMMADAKREYYADAFSYTEAIQKRLQAQIDALEPTEVKLFVDSSAGILSPEFYAKQMKSVQNKRVMLKKELSELKTQNGLSTLEPIKSAFIQGNTAQSRFLSAYPEQQKVIASEVLWNLSIENQNTKQARYKSFYQVLAKIPRNAELETMLGD